MNLKQQSVHTTPRHFAQLDGLRAVAVLAVLLQHFVPKDHLLLRILPWGDLGVHLFFVLSGFLITDILLRCRAETAQLNQSTAFTLRQFYARRFLRIFPLYYAVIAVLYAFNYRSIRDDVVWHFTYLSNVFLSFNANLSRLGHVVHFWSLAVEEQFYLVWPILILLIPRRFLPWLIGAALVFAPLFRLFASLVWPTNYLARSWLPFSCLDTLGAGALLACCRHMLHEYETPYRLLKKLSFYVGFPLFLGFCLLFALKATPYGIDTLFFRSVLALFFFGVVGMTVQGIPGIGGAILSSGPLTFLGKISYGIYVIHHFTIDFDRNLFQFLSLPYPEQSLLASFIIRLILTVVLATLSWYLMEKWLNDLKRFFPYVSTSHRKNALVSTASNRQSVAVAS